MLKESADGFISPVSAIHLSLRLAWRNMLACVCFLSGHCVGFKTWCFHRHILKKEEKVPWNTYTLHLSSATALLVWKECSNYHSQQLCTTPAPLKSPENAPWEPRCSLSWNRDGNLSQFVVWMLGSHCQCATFAFPASFTFPEVAGKLSISLSMQQYTWGLGVGVRTLIIRSLVCYLREHPEISICGRTVTILPWRQRSGKAATVFFPFQ